MHVGKFALEAQFLSDTWAGNFVSQVLECLSLPSLTVLHVRKIECPDKTGEEGRLS